MYDEYDDSIDSSSPVELFTFTRGNGVFRYTTTEQDYVYENQVYRSLALKRGAIEQSENTFKDGVSLTFPLSDTFARSFITTDQEQTTVLTIRRGHIQDPDQQFIVYWKGRVAGATANDNTIAVTCESIFTNVKQLGSRNTYSYACRHALYQDKCAVDREQYRADVNIITVLSDSIIAVDNINQFGAGYFNGGIARFSNGHMRMITDRTGAQITLNRPIQGLAVGQQVALYPGCDHAITTCSDKFDNLDNFGGFPQIPTRNPFDTSLT